MLKMSFVLIFSVIASHKKKETLNPQNLLCCFVETMLHIASIMHCLRVICVSLFADQQEIILLSFLNQYVLVVQQGSAVDGGVEIRQLLFVHGDAAALN